MYSNLYKYLNRDPNFIELFDLCQSDMKYHIGFFGFLKVNLN